MTRQQLFDKAVRGLAAQDSQGTCRVNRIVVYSINGVCSL